MGFYMDLIFPQKEFLNATLSVNTPDMILYQAKSNPKTSLDKSIE